MLPRRPSKPRNMYQNLGRPLPVDNSTLYTIKRVALDHPPPPPFPIRY